MNLAGNLAQVSAWWESVPKAARKTTYRPVELHRGAGIPPQALPTVLVLLGWQRARHWGRQNGRRVLRVWYAPPGHRIASPARGRPPITLFDLFGG